MTPEIQTIGDCAVVRLKNLLADVEKNTDEIINNNDIPSAAVHFHAFRELVDSLQACVTALQKHEDRMSYELLPTMFTNQDVKTIKIDNVGRVTINDKWSARMVDRRAGFDWLRQTGNEGLIVETVSAQTLGAFAKTEALAGKPLPSDVFTVRSSPFVSITKG